MLNENFVILGALLSLTASLIYVVLTIQGKVKPNRVSFLLFALAPIIAFFAQIKQGVGIQSLMTFMTGFSPLLIFIASFFNKKAYWKITQFDLICGGLSLLGLILWMYTKVGNTAIAFSILSDGLAALPIIVKAYKYPETESAYPWLLSSMNGLITLLTIKIWIFAYYGFPIYIFLVNFIIFALIKFKPNRFKLL